MPARRREILAVLLTEDTAVPIQEVARLLGHDTRNSGGLREAFGKEMTALVAGEWAYRDSGKHGFKQRLFKKLKGELAFWSPADDEVHALVTQITAAAGHSLIGVVVGGNGHEAT